MIAEIKMEHLGISLEKFFQINKNRSPTDNVRLAFEMGIQILSALQILHKGGYVHCDLKPDNICV